MKITKIFLAALFTVGFSNVAFAQTTPGTPTTTPGTTIPNTPQTTPGTMGTNNESMPATRTNTGNMNSSRQGMKHKNKMSHSKDKIKTSPKY